MNIKNGINKRIITIKMISLFCLIFFSANIESQTKVVKGKVTTLNNLRIANIDVIAKKAKSHIKTDSIGEYFIVCHNDDVLTFKGKVFRAHKVKIKSSTVDSVNVTLSFIPTEENKEIAVGYGYMTEDQITSAVSYMENNNDDFCRYSDIFDLIRGHIPGVQIIGTGGEPEVIIRGQGSLISSNCALYVIDGMVVNSISNISPCQIRTINVIKDGSSAIYGSRGANGVVLIETIRGPKTIK